MITAPFINTKLLSGIVKKKSGDKTVCVAHMYSYKHKKYKKILNVARKYLVHDKDNECIVGDRVQFYYSRPISARKFCIFYRKI